MGATYRADGSPSIAGSSPQPPTNTRDVISGVDVVRKGRTEPFLDISLSLASTSAHWGGITLENYSVPAVFIPRHEHPEHFLHLVLSGNVKYEVTTKGRTLRFTSRPGTTFLLPHGTVDEVNWTGPTQRMAVAIQPHMLTNALEETAHESEIELAEHWDLIDSHISGLLLEMKADLSDESPAGTMYGESLAIALAVYLLKRYAVHRRTPVVYKGGLPAYRLKRVLNYIGDNLAENLSLSELATIAGMSPHYFSELFKQSTGSTPHSYVLMQRIELAKRHLRDQKLSIIQVGLESGFQNPSHFARVFRRLVGTTPSGFQTQMWPDRSPTERPLSDLLFSKSTS